MGFLSGLFSGNKGTTLQPRKDLGYTSGQTLQNWADTYAPNHPYDPAAPYGGQLTADRSANQNMGQDILNEGLSRPMTNTSFDAAKKQTLDTLNGSYDPRTSPYYQAMKDQIIKDTQTQNDAIMHGSAVSGHLYSDPRLIQQRQLAENQGGQLSTLLGQLYEQERQNQMAAAGQAAQLGQIEENLPFSRATAAEQIGGLAQQSEQANLDRMYNEYLRQVEGSREPYNIYQGLTGTNFSPYEAQPMTVGATKGWFGSGGNINPSGSMWGWNSLGYAPVQ